MTATIPSVTSLGHARIRVSDSEPSLDLLFLDPQLRPGLNVTVRNGEKWLQARPGRTLLIKKTGEDDILATATAVHAVSLPFKHIPSIWLEFEHDPTGMTRKGLQRAMQRAYGEEFDDQTVTVLFFFVDSNQGAVSPELQGSLTAVAPALSPDAGKELISKLDDVSGEYDNAANLLFGQMRVVLQLVLTCAQATASVAQKAGVLRHIQLCDEQHRQQLRDIEEQEAMKHRIRESKLKQLHEWSSKGLADEAAASVMAE